MAAASSRHPSAESDRRLRLPGDRRVRGPATAATIGELAAAKRMAWISLLVWTVLSIVSFNWNAAEREETTMRFARTEAEIHLNKETALRNWIAARGGIYVVPDAQTPPNPYLAHVPDRNVVTSGGKRLTLINTSYLTRLLQESYAEFYGTKGHISSNKPISPANTPVPWERAAYAAFAAGNTEYSGVVEVDGKPYYGAARALKAAVPCLTCHTDPGLKAGDNLGAISILVDLAPYRLSERKAMLSEAVTDSVIWLVGLLGIFTVFRISIIHLRQRQETQQALLESQHLFQTIADYSSDWIFWRNPDGRFRYVSPACERISGYAPEAFYADPALFLNIIHPEDREAFRSHIAEADQGKKVTPQELRILNQDGKVHFISHACRPIYDDDGNFVGIRGANLDITRLRENEQILINQSRHAAMGEMVSNIAHQWRQPISAVGLILQNLEYDFDEGRLKPDVLRGYVARGRELIGRMSTTIDDFRNFFRPEHEPAFFDINHPIREAVRIMHDSFRAHGIEIRWPGDDPVQAFGYPNELAQVLLNLLANAKDSILEHRVAHGVVEILIATTAEGLVLTVRDNGGGIPAAVLPRIFDPYFTTKDHGTGIGLYMSSTIVGHMGGSLVARNIDGGAELILRLPQANPSAGASP